MPQGQGFAGIPPGPLSAYLGVKRANEAAGLAELQKVEAVHGLLAKMQAQQKLAEQRQNIERFAATLPEKDRLMFLANPREFVKARVAGYTLSPGQQRFVGDQPGPALPPSPLFKDLPVPGQPGVSQPTWLRPGETTGTPVGGQKMPEILNPAVLAAQVERARAGKSQISVGITQKGEEAFVKELGKRDAERASEIEQAGMGAYRQLDQIERISTGLKSGRFTTGVFAQPRYLVSQLGELAGVDMSKLNSLGVGDPAVADTVDAASKQIAVEMAKDLSRVTNMSLKFLEDSLPSLSRTPEGNLIIVEVMERAARRKIELGRLMNQFLQRHNTLRPRAAPSYFELMEQMERTNPVISPELKNRIMRGTTTGQARAAQPPGPGWKKMRDAQGREAWVGPNNEVREIK